MNTTKTKATRTVDIHVSRQAAGVLCDLLYANAEYRLGVKVADALYEQVGRLVLTFTRREAAVVMRECEKACRRSRSAFTVAAARRVALAASAALGGEVCHGCLLTRPVALRTRHGEVFCVACE